jgi:TrmH family RNA methyltransferase
MLIESTANPIVKTLRSLELPKGRQARRQFLVEGVRAVEEGLRAGRWPELCLYNRELLVRTERGAKLLKQLTAKDAGHKDRPAPIEASQRAIEAVSATQHPQGIVAAFSFIEWEVPSAQPGVTPLALVCDNIQDPGNLGTLLRTAEAAGVQAVWLSPECVDIYSPKVVRAAMGAHFRLPMFSSAWADIWAGLRTTGIPDERVFATDTEAEMPYDYVDWRQPSALIVSNEAHGLGKEASRMAGGIITIPMFGEAESLNAATAAAVILFETARQRRVANLDSEFRTGEDNA